MRCFYQFLLFLKKIIKHFIERKFNRMFPIYYLTTGEKDFITDNMWTSWLMSKQHLHISIVIFGQKNKIYSHKKVDLILESPFPYIKRGSISKNELFSLEQSKVINTWKKNYVFVMYQHFSNNFFKNQVWAFWRYPFNRTFPWYVLTTSRKDLFTGYM